MNTEDKIMNDGVTAGKIVSMPMRVVNFYVDGFRQMTLGKTLWKIIFIKLIIMFGVLKLFFFPDFLATNFSTDKERADFVIEQMTTSAQKNEYMK